MTVRPCAPVRDREKRIIIVLIRENGKSAISLELHRFGGFFFAPPPQRLVPSLTLHNEDDTQAEYEEV